MINFILFLLIFNCLLATGFMVFLFMIALKAYRLRKRLTSLNQLSFDNTP